MGYQTTCLVKEVKRRRPFKIERLPAIVRIYRFPFQKWRTHGKQALFGVFNIALFMAYQKLVPIKPKGVFLLEVDGACKPVVFDGRNTQFESLYLDIYADGYESEVTALIDLLLGTDGVFQSGRRASQGSEARFTPLSHSPARLTIYAR
jgi:hypothetical protein